MTYTHNTMASVPSGDLRRWLPIASDEVITSLRMGGYHGAVTFRTSALVTLEIAGELLKRDAARDYRP